MPILTPEERFGQRVAERYRLEAVLSTGGMGILFRALDEATGEHVAVKMLKPAYALEPDRVARFLRETRIAAELRHPNLVAVLDVWADEGGIPFLIMELLKGRSLAQELDKRRVLPFDEALSIAIPIVNALTAAHAVGIIHRDINPSNIFLCSDGAGGSVVPKLLDFGIAKCESDGFETQTGLMLGTPGYMAPEQAQLGECSAATDVWGMGAVIYRCVMGHAPHASDSMPELLRKLAREPVPPLVAPSASKPGCATIDRALMRDPHRRYASMEELGRALATAAERSSTEPARPAAGLAEVTRIEPIVPLEAAPVRKQARYARPLAMLGAVLLILSTLTWALAPKSAAFVGTRKTDPLETSGRFVTATATPLLIRAEPQPIVASSTATAPIAAPTTISAPPPQTRAPRSARTTANARREPKSIVTGENSVRPAIIAEPEATTGLPVATEW